MIDTFKFIVGLKMQKICQFSFSSAEMEPQHSQDPEDGHDDEAEAENVDMGMFPGLET